MIVGPRGEILATAGTAKEAIISGEISLADLHSFRVKFPVLDDADDFSLNVPQN
jgi:predicted amidohydrolase